MDWIKTYRDKLPNEEEKLNSLVIDFRTEELLDENAMENALEAVELIKQRYAGPYTLLASGGVDSQAMILAWKKSNTDFRVVHYCYGTNQADLTSIVNFCIHHKIPLDIEIFDAKAFIESEELIQLAKIYECSSPQILTYIKFVKLHKETCIMAGNFLDPVMSQLNWTILALQRFADKDKNNFIPFFFMYTPKLAYSFRSEYIKHSENLQIEELYKAKVDTYHSLGFQVEPQISKLSGFEELKTHYSSVKIDAKTKLKWIFMPSKQPFDLLFRYSLYDSIGTYSEKVRMLDNYTPTKPL